MRTGLRCRKCRHLRCGQQGTATNPKEAKADYCEPRPGEGWFCYWASANWPAATPRWLTLAYPTRNWFYGQVSDRYGGTVTRKCVHIQRASDGYVEQVVCGAGAPGAYVNGCMKPGNLFLRHGAPGPRTIAALGINPYPI